MPESVLVVVDVQADFLPGGALAVPGGDAVVGPVNALVERFAHVVLTQDWHPPSHVSFASSHPGRAVMDRVTLDDGSGQVLWPDHCVQGTAGAELAIGLRADKAQLVIRKGCRRGRDSYSAFLEADGTPTGLAGYLRERGLSRVFVVGLATDFCVGFTAMDAAKAGFDVTLVEDACKGIDVGGSVASALSAMASASVSLSKAVDAWP